MLFGVAMAYAEAAVVAYLRVWLDRVDPYQPQPLTVPPWVQSAEMLRETATLVMLAAVGWLAGRTRWGRCGFFLVVFGVWDTLYYVFLAALTGWPKSPMDWDVLFLVPLPWWGPVWSPVSIAVLMVLGGTLLTRLEDGPPRFWPKSYSWLAGGLGTILSLYVFMTNAISVAVAGQSALRMPPPTWFNWPLFILAWLLMAAPLMDLAWQSWTRRKD